MLRRSLIISCSPNHSAKVVTAYPTIEYKKTWPCILYYLATLNNRGEFWRMRCSKQYSALAQVITCINVGLRNNLNTVISKSIGTGGKHNQIWK